MNQLLMTNELKNIQFVLQISKTSAIQKKICFSPLRIEEFY